MSDLQDFDEHLRTKSDDEGAFQALFESRPLLIPMPYAQHHQGGLHWNMFLSKLRLENGRETDLAYISQATDRTYVVLIELERPDKKLFNQNEERATMSEPFVRAVEQVDEWKAVVSRNPRWIARALEPLLRPRSSNSILMKYVLVIGREENAFAFENRKVLLANMEEERNIRVMTYDTVRRHFEERSRSGFGDLPNICARSDSGRFSFRKLHSPPNGMFAYMTPSELDIDSSQATVLTNWGFEIDAWKAGRRLNVNFRKAGFETWIR